jgi:hypothetical protein
LSRAEYEELQPKTPSKKTGSMEGMVEMTQTKTMILDQKKKKKKKKRKKKNPGLTTTHFNLLPPYKSHHLGPLLQGRGVG